MPTMLYEVEAVPAPPPPPLASPPLPLASSSMSISCLPARAAVYLAALAALLIAAPGAQASAGAPVPAAAIAGRDYRPGEVVVRFGRDTGPTARASVQRGTHVGSPKVFAPHTRVLHVRNGRSAAGALAALRRRHGVASAAANWIAHTSGVPDGPGRLTIPGGWTALQW